MPALSVGLSGLASNIPASRAGMALFAISGRYHGDDDDTTYHLWSSDLGEAVEAFKKMVLNDTLVNIDEMAPSELANALERVYVVSTEKLLAVAPDGASIELAVI